MFNPDLGRWMAPDPYGQFHSPYVGMGYLQDRKEEAFIQQRTNDLLVAIKNKLKKITGNNISIEQLKASRIIIWLKQHNIRQAQYYAGFKYLSSMKKYQQQEMDSLREELEKHFPQLM